MRLLIVIKMKSREPLFNKMLMISKLFK